MPISRSQMERQLRMGGGIMGLETRQQYGLGSIVKSIGKGVKSIGKSVKKFAKSDAGKLALLAAGGYYAGGGFGRLSGGFQFGNLPGGSFFGSGSFNPLKTGTGASKFGSMLSGIGSSNVGQQVLQKGNTSGGLNKTLGIFAGGSLLGGLMSKAQQGDQEAIAATRDLGSLRSYLDSGYRRLGYKEDEIPTLVEEGVSEYTSAAGGYAEGGRIGYANGSEDMILPMRKPETEEMMFSNPGSTESGNPISKNNPVADLIDKYNTYKKAMPGVADETKTYLIEDFKKSLENSGISIEEFNMRLQEQNEMDEPVDMAYGGRMGYAFGTDSPENNAIQAAEMEGLPLNQNPAGVTELDLRDSGGFIPPVGVKEKADDIPAMLANNEFVFTADAVRGMGDGNVDKGAQRMYDMMKKLENGGRV